MASKSDFSSAEWRTLRDAPHRIVIAVAAAGGSGIFGSLKEALAPAGAMIEALQGDNALLREVCNQEEIKAAVEELKEQARTSADFEAIRASFRQSAQEQAKAALEILRQKASPDDVSAYGEFLMKLAERVANAAKEGGFLGFGGERVSEPERAFLKELSEALGHPLGFLEA
jgi:hypothetical protein